MNIQSVMDNIRSCALFLPCRPCLSVPFGFRRLSDLGSSLIVFSRVWIRKAVLRACLFGCVLLSVAFVLFLFCLGSVFCACGFLCLWVFVFLFLYFSFLFFVCLCVCFVFCVCLCLCFDFCVLVVFGSWCLFLCFVFGCLCFCFLCFCLPLFCLSLFCLCFVLFCFVPSCFCIVLCCVVLFCLFDSRVMPKICSCSFHGARRSSWTPDGVRLTCERRPRRGSASTLPVVW